MTAVRSRDRSAGRADPRIEARRERVARTEGRRRLWFIAGVTLVASSALGAIAISKSPLLDVESVTIIGAERRVRGEIITAAAIRTGMPLLEIDVDAAEAAVARVPWIETAAIDRSIGGSVVVTVTEREAMVAVPAGSRHVLVDATGRQLEMVDQRPEGWIDIAGVEASGVPGELVDDDVLDVVEVVDAVAPTLREAIPAIVRRNGELWLTLEVGGEARIGDTRDLDAKLLAVETILARVDLACLAVVDVRVPDAPTVSRTTPTSTPQTASEEPLQDSAEC